MPNRPGFKETKRRWKCEQLLEKTIFISPTGCRVWPGPFGRGGYGKSTAFNKTIAVHRFIAFSYLFTSDEEREANKHLEVRHTCDNPPCCEPSHLILGTSVDNTNDMLARDRAPSGERHPFSKLSQADADQIRITYKTTRTTQRRLATQYGVSQRAILFILQNQSYRTKEALS